MQYRKVENTIHKWLLFLLA